jgi:ribosome-associated protein
VRALAEDLAEQLAAHGVKPGAAEGAAEGRWVLFDLGDVIVHIFAELERGFYALERLWGDAPRVELV